MEKIINNQSIEARVYFIHNPTDKLLLLVWDNWFYNYATWTKTMNKTFEKRVYT